MYGIIFHIIFALFVCLCLRDTFSVFPTLWLYLNSPGAGFASSFTYRSEPTKLYCQSQSCGYHRKCMFVQVSAGFEVSTCVYVCHPWGCPAGDGVQTECRLISVRSEAVRSCAHAGMTSLSLRTSRPLTVWCFLKWRSLHEVSPNQGAEPSKHFLLLRLMDTFFEIF